MVRALPATGWQCATLAPPYDDLDATTQPPAVRAMPATRRSPKPVREYMSRSRDAASARPWTCRRSISDVDLRAVGVGGDAGDELVRQARPGIGDPHLRVTVDRGREQADAVAVDGVAHRVLDEGVEGGTQPFLVHAARGAPCCRRRGRGRRPRSTDGAPRRAARRRRWSRSGAPRSRATARTRRSLTRAELHELVTHGQQVLAALLVVLVRRGGGRRSRWRWSAGCAARATSSGSGARAPGPARRSASASRLARSTASSRRRTWNITTPARVSGATTSTSSTGG